MVTLNGILKQDQIKEITKRDGSIIQKRIIYIEPKDSVFPVKVGIDDHNLKIGKVGDQINLNVEMYPFYFQDGKMKRANVNFYIPNK